MTDTEKIFAATRTMKNIQAAYDGKIPDHSVMLCTRQIIASYEIGQELPAPVK